MKAPSLKMVVDGPQRLRDAKNYREARKALWAEVTQRYKEERIGASIWRRLCIKAKIHREVRAELTKQFPLSALYIASHEMKRPPNQPVQHNAGSRPSSGDCSASKTRSSLGPRG